MIKRRTYNAVFLGPLLIDWIAVKQSLSFSNIFQRLKECLGKNSMPFKIVRIFPGKFSESFQLRFNFNFRFFHYDCIFCSPANFLAGTKCTIFLH